MTSFFFYILYCTVSWHRTACLFSMGGYLWIWANFRVNTVSLQYAPKYRNSWQAIKHWKPSHFSFTCFNYVVIALSIHNIISLQPARTYVRTVYEKESSIQYSINKLINTNSVDWLPSRFLHNYALYPYMVFKVVQEVCSKPNGENPAWIRSTVGKISVQISEGSMLDHWLDHLGP